MKIYNVYIDLSEQMQVEANSKEEAVDNALKELSESGTVWYPKDVELKAEEEKD